MKFMDFYFPTQKSNPKLNELTDLTPNLLSCICGVRSFERTVKRTFYIYSASFERGVKQTGRQSNADPRHLEVASVKRVVNGTSRQSNCPSMERADSWASRPVNAVGWHVPNAIYLRFMYHSILLFKYCIYYKFEFVSKQVSTSIHSVLFGIQPDSVQFM